MPVFIFALTAGGGVMSYVEREIVRGECHTLCRLPQNCGLPVSLRLCRIFRLSTLLSHVLWCSGIDRYKIVCVSV